MDLERVAGTLSSEHSSPGLTGVVTGKMIGAEGVGRGSVELRWRSSQSNLRQPG